MKCKFFSIALMILAVVAFSFTACKSKPKDADIKAAVETALKADPMSANTMVDIKDGVVTISGECKDDACKAHCEELVKGIKGVKSIVNNCSITAVAPVETIVNAADDVLTKGLTDALKDIPGVTSAVVDGKVALKGEIAKAKWIVLKQAIDKLTPKGYDLTGLKIK